MVAHSEKSEVLGKKREHQFQLRTHKRKGLVKHTDWGYAAECTCGWVAGTPYGTIKQERSRWQGHVEEARVLDPEVGLDT